MKRLKITTIALASTILLAGCTQQTTSENNEDNEVAATSETRETTESSNMESSVSMEESDTAESTEETSTEASSTEASTTETDNSEDDVADLEEGAELQDTIDDLDQLNVETATDNPNKRVLLFSNDEGEKQYKSVFIKQKNRLKIIDINNDDLLMNQEIN